MAVILEYKVNGLTETITTQEQLTQATKLYKSELNGLSVGTSKYKEVEGVVAKLKNSNDQLRTQQKTLQNQLKLTGDTAKRSYNGLRTELTLLENKYRQLSEAERRSPFGRATANQVKQLRGELRSINGELGRTARTLGTFGRQFIAAFGVTSAAFLLVGAIKSSIGTLVDYQKENSKLNSILGKTSEQTAELRKEQIALSGTTAFTARQAVQLQTELAKLGFTQEEIIQAGRAVTNFAVATGSDVPEAAALAGASLRSFGLDAREMDRVVSAMSVATTKSALDFRKLQVAMPIVGASAKAAGLNIEQLLGKLGVLSDRGLDASTSATALRNIFIDLVRHGITWEEAVTKINTSSNKLGASFELFNKRGANTALILAENTEAADALGASLVNVRTELQQMVDEQLNNFAGAVTLMKSAWEALLISFGNSTSAVGAFSQTVVEGTTDLLGFLKALNELEDTSDIQNGFMRYILTGRTDFGNLSRLTTELGRTGLAIEDLQKDFENATNPVDKAAIQIELYTKEIERAQLFMRKFDIQEGTEEFEKIARAIQETRRQIEELETAQANFSPLDFEGAVEGGRSFGSQTTGGITPESLLGISTPQRESISEQWEETYNLILEQQKAAELDQLEEQQKADKEKEKERARAAKARQKQIEEDYKKELKLAKDFHREIAIAQSEQISDRIDRTIASRAVPRLGRPGIGPITRTEGTTAPKDLKPLSEEMSKVVALFESGKITAEEFEQAVQKIRLEAEQSQLRRDILPGGLQGEDRLTALQRLAEIEVELNKEKNEKILENEKAVEAEKERIKKESIESSFALLEQANQNILQAALDNINDEKDARLKAAERVYEQQIKAAGNSAAFRARAEEKYQDEVDRINKEAADERIRAQINATLRAGFLAAIQALANTTLPFPASLGALVPIAAATAASVANIKSTGYAHGGFTEPIGTGAKDNSGERPVGAAHAGEWYMPRTVLQTAEGRAIAEKGERLRIRMGYRSNRHPGYAEGGFTTGQPFSVPAGVATGMEVSVSIEESSIEQQARLIARETARETATAVLDAMQSDIRRREREGRNNNKV